MTAVKTIVTVDDEGRLNADAETLSKLKNRRFELQEEGQTLRLEARPLPIYEIEDPAERQRAFRLTLERLTKWSGPTWPAGHNVRDEIYD